MTHRTRGTIVLAAAVCAAASASPLRADPAAEYRKLLEAKRAAFVSIKFVLKLQMGGMMRGMGDQESENEINGVMIDPQGLVLCSNTQISGFTNLLSQFGAGVDVSAKPRDIKVLIGDDTEGIEASFVARDTELDLAWVRVKEPGERKFELVDLAKSAGVETGDAVLTLRRMGKYFDRVRVVGEGRIGGVTTKPRRLYVPSTDLTSGLGLPAFTAGGEVVGVTILQMPDAEDAEASISSRLAMMTGLQDVMSGMILPAEEVVKATERARKVPATAEADEAEPEDGEEAAPESPEEEKPKEEGKSEG